MLKLLFRLVFVIVVGVLVYNYFLGTPEEKDTSRAIFQSVKQLGKSTWGLLKSEKAKLDAGKYDTALEKINTLFGQLRSHARENRDQGALNRLQQLDQERQSIEARLEQINRAKALVEQGRSLSSRRALAQDEQQLKEDLGRLFDETETLMQDMEQ
jgi:vacuolar-type H+-ATPase subunit I/STV1